MPKRREFTFALACKIIMKENQHRLDSASNKHFEARLQHPLGLSPTIAMGFILSPTKSIGFIIHSQVEKGWHVPLGITKNVN
jgi:hypothetical protein